MIDLGTVGSSTSSAQAVSSRGQVVGFLCDCGPLPVSHAFSWTRSGGMIDLGTLGGEGSFAVAVNARGQIVGRSQITNSYAVHAVLWQVDPGKHDDGDDEGDAEIQF